MLEKRMNEGSVAPPDITPYYIAMVIIEWDTHKFRETV